MYLSDSMKKNIDCHPDQKSQKQKGITLIESLVALLILALGILGLVSVQARMLVETRVSNSRATAVRLIGDLNERMQLNRAGAIIQTATAASGYVSPSWGAPSATLPAGACTISSTNLNSSAASSNCTSAGVASYDVWRWRRQVAAALMDGQATVTQVAGTNQVRVVVAWRMNEKDQGAASSVPDTFKITFPGIANNDICSTTHVCHMQYLQLPN